MEIFALQNQNNHLNIDSTKYANKFDGIQEIFKTIQMNKKNHNAKSQQKLPQVFYKPNQKEQQMQNNLAMNQM